jgi:uncharacterized membrane protein YccC
MTPFFQSRVFQFWIRLRGQTTAVVRRMDWFRGLRAAVALSAPMVLGSLAGMPSLGWAGLGGFEAIVADTGGSYRTRLSSLATLSLGGAAGLFLGSLAGEGLHWALPVTVLWCFVWSYLAVLGQPFSSAGVLVQLIYICGVGAPTTSWREALLHAGLLLAGGAWAALLSLLLWPLDAYRPARSAVSGCYIELASFLGSVAELFGREQQGAGLWHRLAQDHQYRVRRAVEQGWQAVAAIRAEHQSDTAQGYHLVVLLENADLLIARTVALAEHLEAQSGPSGARACFGRSLAGLEELRTAELWVASLLESRRGQSIDTACAIRQQMESLPRSLENCLSGSDPASRFLLSLLTGTAALVETAIESTALLRLGKPPVRAATRGSAPSTSHFGYVYERLGQLRQGWNPGRIVDQLTANFTSKSLILRHSARVAVVCGLDVALILRFHVDHGYWLLMTSLLVLQPHVSGTMRRGMERIGGTVAGGILAALLAAGLHSQIATAIMLFPLAVLTMAILPVSYTAFAFFITPTFVLAWLPYSGDWQLALVRTGNTVVGALLSVAAMLFLFPTYERERAPEFLRASLGADRRYLAQLAEAWKTGARSSRLLASARRATGLAHNDTEESLERLLAESWPRRLPFAQFVTAFVTYLRRFAQSVTTLTALDGERAWKQSSAVQDRLALLDRRLAWLEAQTGAEAESATAPWPEADAGELPQPESEDHPGERQLGRLERQAEVLRRQLTTLHQRGWLPGAPQKAAPAVER